jgi:hypothetical protein
LFATSGELDDGQPKILDVIHHGDELLEIDGLGDVAVGVEVVGFQNVLFGFGGGQDYHGDGFEKRITLDLCEDLAAVFEGEIEVEEDEVRADRILVFTLLAETGEGFFAVVGDDEVVLNFALAKNFLREADVRLVVFDE